MVSPRKSAGDVTAFAPTPAQPVPTTPMDAGEFTNSLPSRRSTGSPTQPGRNSGVPERPNTGPPGRSASKVSVKSFPADLGISSEHAHYMMFTPYRIKGSMGSKADNAFEKDGGGVALPIPGAPAVTYEQGWETDTKGAVTSAIQSGLDAVGGGKPGDSDIQNAWNSLTTNFKSATNDLAQGGELGDIGSVIVAKALGGRIGVQSKGLAIFDQSFAVYGGPAYRTFSFAYSLMPLSLDDAQRIKDIVDFFKVNSAPKQGATNLARIYQLPKAFGITYHNKGKENKYMNKIGKCALTSMGVTYGGDKFNVFDGTDVPVQIDLSLAFTELQLQDSTSMEAGY